MKKRKYTRKSSGSTKAAIAGGRRKRSFSNKVKYSRGATTSYSRARYGKWTRKQMVGTECNNTIQYLVNDRATSALGFQQMFFWKALGTTGNGIPTIDPGNASSDDLRKIYWNLFQTAPSGQNATRNIFIDKIDWEFEFSNTYQIPAHVELYECISRRDHSEDPLVRITEGLTREGLSTSLANPAYQTYGVTPFDSAAFCQFFKVLKKVTFMLNPGRIYNHTMRHQIKRKFNGEDIDNVSQYFKGLSRILLIRVWGTPVNDDVTKTSVLPGTVAIDMMTRKKITYGLEAPQNPSLTTVINNMPAPAGVAPEVFMNPETLEVDQTNVGA